MPKLGKWSRSLFSDTHDSGHNIKTPQLILPPGLPPERKHLLTPRPSCEEIAQLPTPSGAFFERLPRELRDQILIAAFGNRTVHIDLQLKHPQLPDASCNLTHAQVNANGEEDPYAEPRWEWWSSVCHRHPLAEAWDDRCQLGSPRNMCDHFYSGQWPLKCFLGVMGWLLTCRQA